jgi:hypothetical protein
MYLEADVLRRIEELKKQTNCHRDFSCIKSNFEDMGKVRIVDCEKALECLEERGKTCNYSIMFGFNNFFCRCPIRRYIAKACKV